MIDNDLGLLVGELFKGNPAGKCRLGCLQIIFSFQELLLSFMETNGFFFTEMLIKTVVHFYRTLCAWKCS